MLTMFPVGYHIVALNVPEIVIQDEMKNQSFLSSEGIFSSAALNIAWSSIIAALAFGAFIGCFFVTPTIQKFGVRISMVYVNNSICIFGSLLLFLSKYIMITSMLLCGRVVIGIYVGMACALSALFIKEIATQKQKGTLGCCLHITVCLGSAVAGILSLPSFLGNQTYWNILLAIPMIVSIIQMIMGRYMHETPGYLFDNRKIAEGIESIKYYYGIDELSIEETVKEYSREVSHVPSQIDWKTAYNNSAIRNGIKMGILVNIAQVFTGAMSAAAYSTNIFKSVSFNDSLTPYLPAIGSLISVLVTLPGMYLIEQYGRRKLILGTLAVCTAGNFSMLIFSIITQYDKVAYWATSIFTISFILMGLSYNIGIGPLAYFVPEELVQAEAASIALGAAVAANWVTTMFTNLLYYPLNDAFGGYSFLLFLIPSSYFLYYFYYNLKETKGNFNSTGERNLACNLLEDIKEDTLNYQTFSKSQSVSSA
uniref:MFS domain-containing protein n=1 Tax=Rhabditophanes sp. KR3021 TaxID=114890 RepID=A0AC35TKY4_9BILA